jgi:hypothetical protein
MGLGKRTINLVKKVLNNKNKRKMYSQEELLYMEIQLERLIEQRKNRKDRRKLEKGFRPETSAGNTENYDD